MCLVVLCVKKCEKIDARRELLDDSLICLSVIYNALLCVVEW